MRKYLYMFFVLIAFRGFATHIVGTEIYYDFLGKDSWGNDRYRLTLKLYRDCNGNTADFDYGALVTVIGGGNETVVNIGNPVVTPIPPTLNSPCDQVPYLCLEEGVYQYTLSLAPVKGGYYVIYQRCCRNNSISNIVMPGLQGTTCYIWIPGPETIVGNSSPRFTNFPPLFLCKGLPIFFDHVAVDPDGDVLEYSLGTPYNGLDGCCPALGNSAPAGSSSACINPPPVCPQKAPPPPYDSIMFDQGYSYLNPFGPGSTLAIDPFTGLLTGNPNMIGQFVICIVVKEYREGVLINTHYRDFQFNIVSCIIPVRAGIADQPRKCMGSAFTFTNHSISTTGGVTYKWDFGVPGITSDTSNLVNPTYQYPDTGKYTVTLIGNPGQTCTDTIKKDVYIYPRVHLSFPHPEKQCIKGNDFYFEAASNYSQTAAFRWDFGAQATPSISLKRVTPSVKFLEAGLHMVKIKAKQYDCLDSVIDSVRIIERPQAMIGTGPAGLCKPAYITFSNTSKGDDPQTCIWRFSNDSISREPNPIRYYPDAGVYAVTLTIISNGICKDTSSVSANHYSVYPVPKANFEITPRSTTILEPTFLVKSRQFNNVSCEYDFGDGTWSHGKDPYHSYFEPGKYMITEIVINEYGCRDTISDIVEVLPEHRFWIPNAFTPDANNLNDVFKPLMMGIANYKFEIFDRWGHQLFSTNEPAVGWDGRFRGELCKNDVYIWKVTYKDIVAEVTRQKEGHVVLVNQN